MSKAIGEPMAECCGGCRFVTKDARHMKCRRYPQHLVLAIPQRSLSIGPNQGAMQLIYDWPPVSEDQWCGEFKPGGL